MTRRSLQHLFLAGLLAVSAGSAEAQAPTVAVETVASSNLTNAIGLTHAGDGSGRLFIGQQSGEIKIWDGQQVLVTPFLDISALVTSGFEQGLLGLAFHPNYETNGFFYVNYTDLAGDTVVARYSVSGDPNVANPASADQVLFFNQTHDNHNAGDMHFGPDGYLYIATGEGGGPACNSQDLANLLGKILRIDVDTDDFPFDANADYGIPASNPFVGMMGAAPEIWVWGLRNPWRFGFDRLTGDVFIGDVGEGMWEEVDFVPAASVSGENFGWPWFEGTEAFSGYTCSMDAFASCDDTFVCPILQLRRDPAPNNNCSMIGGFRYRGQAFPTLRGVYFFTDWCTGFLWAAEENGGPWTAHNVASLGGFSFTGFGEDEHGELYIAGGDQIVRIIDPNVIFADGFESGDTNSWSSSTP